MRSINLSLARCVRVARAASASIALLSSAHAGVKVGETFPALATAQLVGGKVPVTEGKILVVDFWASWCTPCKASFPALGKISADYAERGVVLVGVSVDESAAAYAAFMKKNAPAFPAFHDAKQDLVRAVQVPTMPTTYLIDRQGRVRFVHSGFHGESSDRRLRADLETLLTEKMP